MRQLLLSITSILCALFSFGQSHASAKFQPTYGNYSNITPGVLEAVSWSHTRMKKLENTAPSCSGLPTAYGILGLFDDGKGYFIENGKYIAKLSGISVSEQKSSVSSEINAFGSAYHQLMATEIATGGNKNDGNSIRNVLLKLSEIPDSGIVNLLARDMQAYEVLRFLNAQEQAIHFEFPQHSISLESVFGVGNYAVLSSKKIQLTETEILSDKGTKYVPVITGAVKAKSIEYGPAIWNPAPTCNYSSRNGIAISAITIHTIQGSYYGAISWSQNCTSNVSFHYVIRSSDGQVTQMVLEAEKAWHVGTENPYTIGYEHEGYVNDPIWYTEAMYNSSADLSRDIVGSGYGIPPLRTYFGPSSASSQVLGGCTKIKGHQHFTNQTHTDPGINWDWEKYYRLINNNPSYTTITSTTGNFYDSGGAAGNYQNDERNLWLFQPTSAQTVTLNFSAFNVEVNYDYLYIYDGSTIDAPLLGVYTGTNSPGIITSTGNSLVLEFRSDCGTTAAGWAVTYSSTTIDQNPPTTSIVNGLAWQTDDFTVYINDTDTESAIDQGYYLVAEKNVTDNGWKSNGNYGFTHEDFEDVNTTWTNQVGAYTITNGGFLYPDVNEQNSNSYASVSQDANSKYVFEWTQTITSSGANQRAGMHFFCDAPTLPNRGNSYFVFLRESTDIIQIYSVVNDVFTLQTNDPLTIVQNVAYNCKASFDPVTGEIKVYVNGVLASEWIDPQPLTSGNSISVRTAGCSVVYDDIQVYKSRGGQVSIPAGFGELMSIESENATPTGLVKSIVLDASDNWSTSASETYLLDFSAPVLDFVNDGTTSDIDTFMTATFAANWSIADIHSSIAIYSYAVGTTPNSANVIGWNSNALLTNMSTILAAPILNQLYFISVRGMNNAGWESEFVSDGQRYVNTTSLDEMNALFGLIVVYPNPTREYLKIDGLPANTELYLIDGKGSVVSVTRGTSPVASVDVSKFARGTYQLMIKAGGVFVVKSVVLE